MKSDQTKRRPELRVFGGDEGTFKNLGDCRELTYGQIWQRFRTVYAPRGVSEHELRNIHLKWKRIVTGP
jgi:hypothetical protein